jgi:hypothetical protein
MNGMRLSILAAAAALVAITSSGPVDAACHRTCVSILSSGACAKWGACEPVVASVPQDRIFRVRATRRNGGGLDCTFSCPAPLIPCASDQTGPNGCPVHFRCIPAHSFCP